MPKLQRYTSQVRSVGAIRSGAASAAAFRDGSADSDANAAQELQQLGKVTQDFADELQRQKNNRDSLSITKTLIDKETEFAEREIEMRKNAEPGAEGFTEDVKSELGKFHEGLRGNFTESALSQQNQLKLQVGLARMNARFTQSAVGFEAASQARKVKTDVQESLDTLLNRVALDPSNYTQSLEDASEVVESAKQNGLNEEDARTLSDAFLSGATANRFTAKIDAAQSPEEVVALRDEMKEFTEELDPQQFNVIMGQIDKAENKLEAARVYDFTVSLDEQNAAVSAGKRGLGISESDVKATIKDPVAQKKALRSMRLSRAVGAETVFVESATPAELSARESQLNQSMNQGGSGFVEKQMRLQSFYSAVSRRNKQIKDDVAGYMLKRDKQLNAAALALSENSNDNTRRDYVRQQRIAQTELGVPAGSQKLLTKAMVGQFKAMLSGDRADGQPEDTTQTVSSIQKAAEFWGEDWRQVHRQLAQEKVLTGVDLAVAGMTRPDQQPAAQELVTARLQKSEMEKLVPKEDRNDIRDATLEVLLPLQQTLPASAQSSNAFISRLDSVELLATRYRMKGMDVEDAVEQASREVALDNYEFVEGEHPYRVPKNIEFAQDEIEDGAREVFNRLNLSDVYAESVTGLDETTTTEQMIDAVRSTGGWMTNGDESGLVLVDQFGNRILKVMRRDENGSPIAVGPFEYTWKELAEFNLDERSQPQNPETVTGQ